ncbi:hypothetical protein [Mycolicibacterium sediminis]|uniref:Uncharacterized protein n=1 Tax=Mycolicibacterium sediminis TaxID=1286180 RepID=A0A7I7QLK0_9MYCO|nr:hypothetical protein [Mycolicibacterium sediminis]BBY26877.1 hypothetical protein MSEDJ_09730 [Mycolicibacterium sediminis]
MSTAAARFRTIYGSHPLHLLVLIAGIALFCSVIATIGVTALWNPKVWWQSIAVWFAAAIILHDLVLFPVYAVVDRLLVGVTRSRRETGAGPRVPLLNYVRAPALGAGLTLLVFLPGIIEQGAPAYVTATGQTQEPFLGRWLWLTAAMFLASAVVYAVRLLRARRR